MPQNSADSVLFGVWKKRFRDAMVAKCRSCIYRNQQIQKLKDIFSLAAGKQFVSPSIGQSLTGLAGLRAGKTNARETEPIHPVSNETAHATLVRLLSAVETMILV